MYNLNMNTKSALAQKALSLRATAIGVALCMLFIILPLTSCGSNSSIDASKPEALPTLKVQKNGSEKPTVEYSKNATIDVQVLDEQNGVGKNVERVLDQGDGDEIQDGQDVTIGYIYYTMPDFSEQTSSWDDSGSFEVYTMQQNDSEPNSLYNVLRGLRVGAVLGIATPGYTPDGTGLDMSGINYSIQVLVVESTKFPNTRATGKDVPKSQLKPNFPKVTLADDGTPSIKLPDDFTMPIAPESEQLKIGDGAEIDETTVASYAYVAFDIHGNKIQSTWDEKVPLTTSFTSLNEVWKEALKGAHVGDQYLIIAPALTSDSSLLDEDQDIIYVVDVLDVR